MKLKKVIAKWNVPCLVQMNGSWENNEINRDLIFKVGRSFSDFAGTQTVPHDKEFIKTTSLSSWQKAPDLEIPLCMVMLKHNHGNAIWHDAVVEILGNTCMRISGYRWAPSHADLNDIIPGESNFERMTRIAQRVKFRKHTNVLKDYVFDNCVSNVKK